MCVSHGIVELMELQDEAITVKAMAPLEAHITAYMTVWHSKPSTEDGEPAHTSPTNSLKQGNTMPSASRPWWPGWPQAVAACGGITSRNYTMQNECTPSSPPPSKWACPLGSREPEEDDQEVTFPGGEGGVHWGNPLQLQNNQLEEGFPLDHPSQAPCPAPAGSDMGQLITALTSGLHIGTPKINTFSGNITPGKTEVSYEPVEPWGSMHKRPLPRVSGLGEHHEISQGGSGRHGLVHGPYCQCLWYFRKTFGYFWNRSVIRCVDAKSLQNYTRK